MKTNARSARWAWAAVLGLTAFIALFAVGCGGDDGESADGLTTERGKVTSVAYAGMITRYFVELESGGELQVVRQNLETTSEEALEQRGLRVRVGWRDEHAYAIPDSHEATPEEGRS